MSRSSELIEKLKDNTSQKFNVNGYSIRYNPAWETWQVSHPKIGARVGEFNTKEEAIDFCRRG